MSSTTEVSVVGVRKEIDSLGEVSVPAATTQTAEIPRSAFFSIMLACRTRNGASTLEQAISVQLWRQGTNIKVNNALAIAANYRF